jgi:hypothetical protein
MGLALLFHNEACAAAINALDASASFAAAISAYFTVTHLQVNSFSGCAYPLLALCLQNSTFTTMSPGVMQLLPLPSSAAAFQAACTAAPAAFLCTDATTLSWSWQPIGGGPGQQVMTMAAVRCTRHP